MTANFPAAEWPEHVPAAHVVDFDYLDPGGAPDADLHATLKALHDGPDVLWTPRNGGHWIVTRAQDVRWVRAEHAIFSHREFGIPRGAMNVPMPPVTTDPPEHARFRAVLNPAFTPGAARALTHHAREVAGDLAEALRPNGSCEFVAEFARRMPVIVFLGLLGLPTERSAEFAQWAVGYTSAKDQATKDRCAGKVAAFLAQELDARAASPRDDLLSRIVAWRTNPRFGGEHEVLGMAMVSFIGGLDTLSNLMSFAARHLATAPEARRRLREEPEVIPRAVEEYLRRHGLTMTGRLLRRDVAHKGVTMRKGELVLVCDPLAGVDERVWSNPLAIDFDRDCSVHDSFGNAEHRCLGEHLARMELAVFIEEWLRRIPDFTLDPHLPPVAYSGPVVGMSQLGLVWNA